MDIGTAEHGEKILDAGLLVRTIIWVNHTTLTDPLVMVGWGFLLSLRGYIEGKELYKLSKSFI